MKFVIFAKLLFKHSFSYVIILCERVLTLGPKPLSRRMEHRDLETRNLGTVAVPSSTTAVPAREPLWRGDPQESKSVACLVSHHCCHLCRATQCRAPSVVAIPAILEMSRGCRATSPTLPPPKKDPVAPILHPLVTVVEKAPCKNGSRYSGELSGEPNPNTFLEALQYT